MAAPEPILISMNDACRLTSLSRTAILRLLDADRFPPKVDLDTGRRFAFNRSEVLEWIERRQATARVSNWRMAA
jgi:prophage regulatory protein